MDEPGQSGPAAVIERIRSLIVEIWPRLGAPERESVVAALERLESEGAWPTVVRQMLLDLDIANADEDKAREEE